MTGLVRSAPLGLALLAILLIDEARAHGFGQRYDLPLPLWLYLWGAAAAVAVSFAFLAFFRRPDKAGARRLFDEESTVASGTIAKVVVVPLQIFSVAVLALVVAAGFWGNQSPLKNIAPVALWVVWWVGLAYLSAFVGNVWAILNPWSSAFGFADALARKCAERSGASTVLSYPSWLGRWPAIIVFLTFAWAELVAPDRDVPFNIAAALTLYSALTWTGFVLFGREAWLSNAEAFSVFFALLGRFAPLSFSHDGKCWTWSLRPYAVGLLTRKPLTISATAFVLLTLATITVDGFLETPPWAAIADMLLAKAPSGAFEPAHYAVLASILLCVAPLLFGAAFFGVMAVMSKIASGAGAATRPVADLAGLFVLSLVPITIAYHLAHYHSFFLLAGQFMIPLASDPFGYGWDLFGTSLYRIDLSVINARMVWYVAVAAIVAGHIIAVWLSHEIAFQVFGDATAARLSQYPMMALMVGYTMISLWILAQPIVETRG
jgi:hypothetical protein